MKKLFALTIAIFLCYACKKGQDGQNATQMLAAHTWYPYENRITGSDTTTVTTYDSQGNPHTSSSIRSFDTSFVLDSCVQRFVFEFSPNGHLTITNPCSALATMDTTWSLLQGRVLFSVSVMDPVTYGYLQRSMPSVFGIFPPQDSNYNYMFSVGPILSMSNTSFTYDGDKTQSTNDVTYFNLQGNTVDSLTRVFFDVFTTYHAH